LIEKEEIEGKHLNHAGGLLKKRKKYNQEPGTVVVARRTLQTIGESKGGHRKAKGGKSKS